MSNFSWLHRAAVDHQHQDDVHAALLHLQSILSHHEARVAQERRCRIYTFGRFIVIRETEVINFAQHTQRMPIDLLKTVLAFGGVNVGIQAITDILWPDADGDAAHAAFKVALHRLRRLLGSHAALCVSNGTISLAEEHVWVDAWAFERWFDSFAVRGKHAASEEAQGLNMLRMYNGAFLGAAAPSCAHHYSERLRSKFIRSVLMLGADCEQREAWREAAEIYEQGIEADATAEDLYQRAIYCYGHLGQTGRAVDAYRRCRAVLDALLGTIPKMKTQSLYASACNEGARVWFAADSS